MKSLMAWLMVGLSLAAGLVLSARGDDGNAPFPIPPTYTLVNDYYGVLTMRQQMELYEKLYEIEKKNGTQIVVLIVPTIGDVPAQEYAQQVFDKWDIGHNGDGNGVLFLLSRYPAGEYFIATGPGIAGALPDIKVRHIIDDHIYPHFRKQEWFEGINETVDALAAAAQGEATAPAQYRKLLFSIRRDRLIGALLALIGIVYLGVWGWRWHRRRRLTGKNEHA